MPEPPHDLGVPFRGDAAKRVALAPEYEEPIRPALSLEALHEPERVRQWNSVIRAPMQDQDRHANFAGPPRRRARVRDL
jgi:hypothetical protein